MTDETAPTSKSELLDIVADSPRKSRAVSGHLEEARGADQSAVKFELLRRTIEARDPKELVPLASLLPSDDSSLNQMQSFVELPTQRSMENFIMGGTARTSARGRSSVRPSSSAWT